MATTTEQVWSLKTPTSKEEEEEHREIIIIIINRNPLPPSTPCTAKPDRTNKVRSGLA